ncbi:TPA: Holliday junction resolvase [archaeon]|nr:Holliday junction resolvase [Candidatus Undinarchaeales archaeon SRR5007147.bin71]
MVIKDKYGKGARAERELIGMLWERGFAALRVAGSGVSRRPCPDVVASDGKMTFAFECKSVAGDYVHLSYDEIVKLITFSQTFGAKPWIAVKFGSSDWVFLDMAKIQMTKGENFKVSKTFAYDDGKRLDELIEMNRDHSDL